MCAEHLSQEEIDALLGSQGASPPTREWEPLRLVAAAALQRVWVEGESLVGTRTAVGGVELVEQAGEEARAQLGAGAVWARLPIDGGAAAALLAVQRDLALALVASALGSEIQEALDSAGAAVLAEVLSQLPVRALAEVFDEAGWSAQVGALEVLTEGEAPALPERAVVLSYSVEAGPARGAMSLVMPAALGRRLLSGLGADLTGPAPTRAGESIPAVPVTPDAPATPGAPATVGAAVSASARVSGTEAAGVQAGAPIAYRPAQFAELAASGSGEAVRNLDLLLDVTLQVTVELGRTQRQIRDVLALGPGSIVELEKLAGEPVDLLVNGRRIARGEVVVVDEHFAVRITEIVSPAARAGSLGR